MGEDDPASQYVAANRDRFTREALERRLREAGHAPEAIDAAVGRSQPDTPTSTVPTSTVSTSAVPTSAVPTSTVPTPPPIRRISVLWPPRAGRRLQAGQAVIAAANVALFLWVASWYASAMSVVGALIAGVLLSFGVGSAWLLAMTAYGESSAKLRRDNLVAGFAAAIVTPIAVLFVLTGICVAVSRPIDWLTGGLP